MEGTTIQSTIHLFTFTPSIDLERYQPDCLVKKEGAAMAPS
ncbi:hypothetical protein ABGT22_09365 [Peribacillus frigoritolerans]